MSHHVEKAHRTIRWNLTSSTIYEVTRILHNAALLWVLPISMYGTIGTIFSLTYFAMHFGDFGGSHAHTPFIDQLSSRTNLVRYAIAPQLALLTITSIFIHGYWTTLFASGSVIYAAILTSISEGMRCMVRSMLHAQGRSRTVAPIEIATTTTYMCIVWSGFMFGYWALTPTSILLPYCASSLFAMSYLTGILFQKTTSHTKHDKLSFAQIISSRIALTVLHTPKNLLSGNFLVPFLSTYISPFFGALAKVADEVARAFKSIAHATVGYSGSSLLRSKQIPLKESFAILWQKLNELSITSILFFILLLPGSSFAHNGALASMLVGFICITLSDYMFVLYEQLFLVSSATWELAPIRAVESIVSACIVYTCTPYPGVAIGGIGAVRVGALLYTAWHAHRRWHVHPHYIVSQKKIIIACIVSISVSGAARALLPFFRIDKTGNPTATLQTK